MITITVDERDRPDERCGLRPRPAAVAEPEDRRSEHRGHDDGHGDRGADDPERRDREPQHDDHRGHDEDAPSEGGEIDQPGGHEWRRGDRSHRILSASPLLDHAGVVAHEAVPGATRTARSRIEKTPWEVDVCLTRNVDDHLSRSYRRWRLVAAPPRRPPETSIHPHGHPSAAVSSMERRSVRPGR